MEVTVRLRFSADGYGTEAEELAALCFLLDELNSAAVSVRVHSVTVEPG